MSNHYFVTGASGFIGRHLVTALLARGAQVTALYRTAPTGIDSRIKVVLGSLEKPETYKAALIGVTHVVHAAGDARFGNGNHFYAINRDATQALLGIIKETAPGLQRFVFLSSFAAVDRAADDDCRKPVTEASGCYPTTDYGKSKLAAEQVVAGAGVPFTILRPALVVGADMRAGSHCAVFVRMALRNHPVNRIDWPGKFSVISVDDVVSAIIHTAESDATRGETYMLAGETISLGSIFEAAQPRSRLFPYFLPQVVQLLRRWVPFNVKALVMPALTADEGKLRATGWKPRNSAPDALVPVIAKARRQSNMQLPPAGRTVVTGAASGLGRALAEKLAALGRDLLLVDIDVAALAESCKDFDSVERVVADLSDTRARQALVTGEAWQRNPINELFLIAGIGARGNFADVSITAQQRVMDVNVNARMALAHAALQGMRAQQAGRIVIISSSSAFQPLPLMAVYAASNAALLSWGEALGAEVSGDGIDVLTVCPGGMQTGFQSAAGVREVEGEKLQSPAEVADIILRALPKGTATVFTAFRSLAMSLLARGLPRKMSVMLWHRMMSKLR